MINILKEQIKDKRTNEEKINFAREILQILILKILYEKKYFKYLSFVGGTALRMIYNLQRFSEDLDFSLINKKEYNFSKLVSDIQSQLYLYNLDAEIKILQKKIVNNIMIKFKNILHQLKLSNIKEQKLFVKIEIDTNPPKGWNTEISLVNKIYMFAICHFDLPSLYATKLHACFFRKYTKGRDIYDFIWHLGKNIEPNYKLLNNAILQTEKINPKISSNNFKQFLKEKVKGIDFNKAKKDVEKFLINKQEMELFNKRIIEKIIESKFTNL